jgi:hypothetical protein
LVTTLTEKVRGPFKFDETVQEEKTELKNDPS